MVDSSTTSSINSILETILKNFNTLLECPARFSGAYGGHKIHYFIESIEYYKKVKCIPDEQAVQELEYLLQDQALNWWLRRKAKAGTWSEALTLLENQYSRRRPAHAVYREILQYSYDDYISKEDFVDDKIELFNELSQPEMKEEQQLQFIFALLPINIFNKINNVKTYTIKDLKEQLNLLNQELCTANLKPTTPLQSNTNMKYGNSSESSFITNQPRTNNTNVVGSTNAVIKVRPTEELMPKQVEPDQNSIAHCNESSKTSGDHFQIDSDIMTQINNIIDESEMNMDVFNQNNQTITNMTQQMNDSTTSFNLVSSHKEATQQPVKQTSTILQQPNKNSLNVTKKQKLRCSFCRRKNHTADVCFKRAKTMNVLNSNILQIKTQNNSVDLTKTSSASKSSNGNNNEATTITTSAQAEAVPPLISISTATTTTTTTSNVTATHNSFEKPINTSLTTKLIAPIKGPVPSKTFSPTLPDKNTPSPKCHQCGMLGYYKSICLNCSPIYNNNSKTHLQLR